MREYLLSRFNLSQLRLGILHRRQVYARFNLLFIFIWINRRYNKRKYEDYQHDNQADHGNLILFQAAHAVLPESDALSHYNEALFLAFICREEIFDIHLK